MAYYFIFPENDNTLYSHPERTNMNTGGDEILELTKERGTTDQLFYPTRILIKFKEADISTAIGLMEATDLETDSQINLQLTSIQAKNMTNTQVLEVYALSQSWSEGTNKYLNKPSASNGATWLYRDNSITATGWSTTIFSSATTGSIKSSSLITGGGGN